MKQYVAVLPVLLLALGARWIAEAAGAVVFPIQTAYTCPSDYGQAVAVGEGQDIDQPEPALAALPENVGGFDTPVAGGARLAPHHLPLRVFLNGTNLSGKTVYVVTTHRGSHDVVIELDQ